MSNPSHSPRRTYHVFPSFHGEDLRRGFLAHLREKFKSKGIDAFYDTRMEMGKSITPQLTQAIEGSRIAVVLFSKNYASSGYCLDELTVIAKCSESGLTVIPVFYEVEPSHVRKQKGYFGDVFKKTCDEKIKDNDEGRKRFQGWKQALEKVSEIVGQHTDSWVNDDPGMITKIVDDILEKLMNSTSSSDFNDLVGMDAHKKVMEPLLCLDSDEVRMIGIWGPLGIGKTTIARSLLQDHANKFELSTIMEDIKGRYPESYQDMYGMQLNLQSELMAKIIKQDALKISHLGVAPNWLKNKKVLVVLDDVDRLEQLEAMAKTIEWFGPGSRIIITTEDVDILQKHDDINHIYKVAPPNDKEALEILCKYAFPGKVLKDGFKDLAVEATKLSLGRPFGLRILGSHFKTKTKQEWKIELQRLKASVHKDMKKILMFSYEALSFEDQKLFLRIAHFFKGERSERLQAFLGEGMKAGVEVLVKKSLISEYLGYIKMHNLIVQFGRELVRYDPLQKSICGKFLDDAREIVQVLTDETRSISIIGIDLNISHIKRETKISGSAFARIYDLQFLKVYHQHGDNSSGILILPDNLDYLSRELRLLHWEYFPTAQLPPNFNTEFLVKLYMPYSKLEKLWDKTQPLENLRRVDLQFSENLKELPDLSTATSLQRLDLRRCSGLEKLPDSIGNAINLEELNACGCSNLKQIPSSIGNARNLQRLFLSRCSSLDELPSSIWNVNLIYLDLSYCSNLVKFPAPIKKHTKLLQLNLSHCSKLEKLPYIGNLIRLHKLYLGWCSSLVKLPPSLGDATNLSELDLSGCSSLKELPSSIGNLQKLSKLTMKGCSKLEALPSDINLKSLEELDLTDCSLLRSFPEISTNIRVVKVSGTAIEEVPSSIKSWSRFNDLQMSYCENLKELPHALGIITVLHVSDTETQKIAPWIKNLSRLRQLVLTGCKKIVSLPKLPDSLSNLHAEDCESLKRLDCSFPNPKICLNFANCFKLNQEAKNLIIHTSTNSYAILPGRQVPGYFTHRATTRDSVTLNLTQIPLPTTLRLKVCILLAYKGEDEAGDRKMMRVSSNVVKPNALIAKNIPGSHFLTLLSKHLYVFEIEAEVKDSTLKLVFKVNNDKWKVGKCGVELLEVPSVHEHGESSRGDKSKLTESVRTAIQTKLELKSKEKHMEN